MAARCFVDSCGITWEEVITGSGPAFSAGLNLEPGGSLKCPDLLTGLSVNLFDETVASVSAGRECANILRRDGAGNLHALIPNAVYDDLVGDMRSIPNNGTSPGSSIPSSVITNTTGCEALLMLRGQFRVNWKVADTTATNAALDDPYNALLQMRIKFNGAPVDVQYFSVGGLKPVSGDMYLKEWRDIYYVQVMSPGQSFIITDDVVHDLSDGVGVRRNFAANIATTPPNFATGYQVVLTSSILPLGVI